MPRSWAGCSTARAYEGVSLDGIDQWAAITGAQSAHPREELLINADDLSDADGPQATRGRDPLGSYSCS